MTEPIEYKRITCPWCSEPLQIQIDLTAGDQIYTEDCQICCAPIVLNIQIIDDKINCTASRE